MRSPNLVAVACSVALIAGCGESSGPASNATTASHATTASNATVASHSNTASRPHTATATYVSRRPVFDQPPPVRVRPVLVAQIPDRLPTGRHVVALTFDAGADNAGAPKILPELARTGVPATFFLTGRWAEIYPEWARRIAVSYPIANHTYDHTDLLRLPLQSVSVEVLKARDAIMRAIARPPVPLFRFPYGSSNSSTLAAVNRLGYTAVGWTVDTLGWEGTSLGQSVQSVISRALAHVEPGEIILMHVGANPRDHSTLDADALPAIISGIRARGYRFVTLPEYL